MLDFLCATCGKRLQADESLAGQAVQCPGCGTAMLAQTAVPMSPWTAISTQPKVMPPTSSDGSFSEGLPPLDVAPEAVPSILKEPASLFARCLPFVVVAIVLLTLVALFVPAVEKVREASARTQSTNNLKNISLSAHSFFDANKRLPFNGSSVSFNKEVPYALNAVGSQFTSGSWGFQICSYMDQGPLFNAGTSNFGIAAMMCPGRGRPSTSTTPAVGSITPPWSDYVINPWLNDHQGGGGLTTTSAVPDNKRTLAGITDGTSNTIFFGHGQINTNDYATTVATPGYMNTILIGGTTATALSSNPAAGPVTFARDSSSTRKDAARGWGSPFSQGCLMAMCDATVRMFPYSIGVGSFNNGQGAGNNTLAAFLTPTGGEAIIIPDN